MTGGSRGIGLAIATALAHDGCAVTLIARKSEELESAKMSIPKNNLVTTLVLDVVDTDAVKKFSESLSNVDILINAAGAITPIGAIETVDPLMWRQLLEINVFGTFLMTQACIPAMKKNGGTIINFVGGGEGAFPNFSAYAASKGAIARFTETAAAELKEYSISVNAIAPGAVNTQMTKDMIEAGERAGIQYQRALAQEQNSDATPEKAVHLAQWLSSDDARGISGKIISAQWDDYEKFPAHANDIAVTDVYTMRRIRPKDRGFTWEN